MDEATPPTMADKDATAAKDDEHDNDEDNGGGWRTVKKARKTFTDNNDW